MTPVKEKCHTGWKAPLQQPTSVQNIPGDLVRQPAFNDLLKKNCDLGSYQGDAAEKEPGYALDTRLGSDLKTCLKFLLAVGAFMNFLDRRLVEGQLAGVLETGFFTIYSSMPKSQAQRARFSFYRLAQLASMEAEFATGRVSSKKKSLDPDRINLPGTVLPVEPGSQPRFFHRSPPRYEHSGYRPIYRSGTG